MSIPYLSTSRRISCSATAVAEACACRSPSASVGTRVFETISPTTSAEVAAAIPDPDRRDADPLLEVLLRVHVERARDAAAHVRPVPVRLRVGDDLAFVEDRPHDAHVVEVRAADVRVVDREHVARVDVVGERLDHRLAGEVQRADVDGDVLRPLHDRVALAITERGREVTRVDDERVARAQDLLGHLVDDRDEGVLQHLERDRVEGVTSLLRGRRRHSCSSRCMRMFSHSSTSARQPGGTTVVESS